MVAVVGRHLDREGWVRGSGPFRPRAEDWTTVRDRREDSQTHRHAPFGGRRGRSPWCFARRTRPPGSGSPWTGCGGSP